MSADISKMNTVTQSGIYLNQDIYIGPGYSLNGLETGYYISAFDTTTQTNAGATFANKMNFNTHLGGIILLPEGGKTGIEKKHQIGYQKDEQEIKGLNSLNHKAKLTFQIIIRQGHDQNNIDACR